MKAIVAVDSNWGIGINGELLCKIPEDMKRFKAKTINNVVIMGRRTFESFPNNEPLKDRVNIVLTKYPHIQPIHTGHVLIYPSIEHLMFNLRTFENIDNIYVIGGQTIYEQLLPYCSEVFITKILANFPADKHFPNLDIHKNWAMTEMSDYHYYQSTNAIIGKIYYRFTTYTNKDIKDIKEII